jgi:MEMO1 family protein
MDNDPRIYPRLRYVEAIPDPDNSRILLRDPTQLATGMLAVGQGHLTLLTLLDGKRTRLEVQTEYVRKTGDILLSQELEEVLETLDESGYLAGPSFEEYYCRLEQEYRDAPYRPLRDCNSYGVPADELSQYLNALIESASGSPTGQSSRLLGLVTPHLDFDRGSPCYGAGYRELAQSVSIPRRVVILGTNHFGRSSSVVATSRDFETPWGVVETDREFLARLSDECEANLYPYELDHLREHSIELQVIWLRHLLGNGFTIVPVLIPDPSGPNGTSAGDPDGVDTRRFALELGQLIREDPRPTLVIASADLSHVGGYFGDDRELTPAFLAKVRNSDEAVLALIDANGPEALREHMSATGNPTRVCSTGCLYALMTALGREVQVHRLDYHQAVTPEINNAVTCAAYAFYGN